MHSADTSHGVEEREASSLSTTASPPSTTVQKLPVQKRGTRCGKAASMPPTPLLHTLRPHRMWDVHICHSFKKLKKTQQELHHGVLMRRFFGKSTGPCSDGPLSQTLAFPRIPPPDGLAAPS